MWIGAIRLVVHTADSDDAGTDSLVRADVVRDGDALIALKLDYTDENDLERGATRAYEYVGLPRRNDSTPELPDDLAMSPSPYPDYGIEFSDGLQGHLVLRLRIAGDDMWIKDSVSLHVKEIRQRASSFDTLDWEDDRDWSYVGSWNRDVALSTDSDEGETTWNLRL